MRKFSSFLIALLVLVTFLSAGVYAAGPKLKKRKPVDTHTVISSISPTSITVKSPKQSVTYTITKLTTITYENKTVAATDLKPGMRVSVTMATDPTVAEVIIATKGPKVAPAKKNAQVKSASGNY